MVDRVRPTLLLIGLGGLGSVLLELLAREKLPLRILAAGRKSSDGTARCNLARFGAGAQGYQPQIEFVQLDLQDTAATAATIAREQPDIILSTATLQTWWLTDLLPPEPAAAIRRGGFGMWLPIHIPLTLKLMQAVREAGYEGITLTAPFPDVVNCALGRIGLAPTCGIGNIDEIVPKVHVLAAARLGRPLDEVQVTMVGHHALGRWAYGETQGAPPPFFLRVEHLGRDVTEEVGAAELLLAPAPFPSGVASHFLTAGAAIGMIRALLSPHDVWLHAPGLHGLPGGYPVAVRQGNVNIRPIPGLSMEEAININERSHAFDGIESIEADGTIVLSAATVDAMRSTLGYECERIRLDEAETHAKELMTRFRAYALQHGVTLP